MHVMVVDLRLLFTDHWYSSQASRVRIGSRTADTLASFRLLRGRPQELRLVCVCLLIARIYCRTHTCVEVRGNFQESVLSFYSLGPRNSARVVRLGDKHLYLLLVILLAPPRADLTSSPE